MESPLKPQFLIVWELVSETPMYEYLGMHQSLACFAGLGHDPNISHDNTRTVSLYADIMLRSLLGGPKRGSFSNEPRRGFCGDYL